MQNTKENEPIPFNKIYPLTIVTDRYSGTYSKGKYLAFNNYVEHIPSAVGGGDMEEEEFWKNEENYGQYKIGKGETPNDAYCDLYRQLY